MAEAQVRTLRRTAIATTAVAGLHLAWLYALLDIAGRGLELDVSVPSVLLIYGASALVARGLRATGYSRRTATVVSWLVWPLATLLLLMVLLYPDAAGVRGSWAATLLQAFNGIAGQALAAVFIVGASAVLWWFGTRLATNRMTHETVLVEFQFGLMALAGSLLIGYLAGVDVSATSPVAVVFVGLGLVGAAAAREDDEGGPLFFRQGGTWWGMLLVGVSLVLLLGLLASILFTPDMMHLLGRGLRALWGLVDRLLSAIAGLFGSSDAEMELPPAPETLPPQNEEPGFSLTLPDWLLGPSRIVYGVFMAGLALLAVWRVASYLFTWMRRRGDRGGVQIESLPGAFRLDMARFFRRVVTWLRRLFAIGALRRRPREESEQTASVRRLYADMLRWGAESGLPRERAQTPFEYQRTLCAALPAHRTDVTLITESYVRARYGAQPPTEAELHELEESRRRLKK